MTIKDRLGLRPLHTAKLAACDGQPMVDAWKSLLAEVRWRTLKDFLEGLGCT